jgi:hypothetical protein
MRNVYCAFEGENKHGRLVIQQDANPQDPREDSEPVGKLVYRAGARTVLGDTPCDGVEQFARICGVRLGRRHADFSQAQVAELAEQRGAVILPVWAYIHSGTALCAERERPGGQFSDRFDSGQSGWAVATAAAVRKEFGNPRDPAVREKVEKCLQAELAEFEAYINGDVYGYIWTPRTAAAADKSELDEDDLREEDEDSCWGFYGTDWRNNGMWDYLPAPARELLIEQGEVARDAADEPE